MLSVCKRNKQALIHLQIVTDLSKIKIESYLVWYLRHYLRTNINAVSFPLVDEHCMRVRPERSDIYLLRGTVIVLFLSIR